MKTLVRWLCIALAAMIAHPAMADELRPAVIEMTQMDSSALSENEEGSSQGTLDHEWVLEWKLPVAANRSQSAAPTAQPVVPDVCEIVVQPVERAASLALLGRTEMRCSGDLAGEAFGLVGLIGNADGIARFVPLDGPVQSFRLTAAEPTATIRAEPNVMQVLRDYFIIGAEHILFGWDHLLFVIALVLLVRTPWSVVKAATAFTIAHSITLVATSLGYTGLPSRPVEALIALSIVFLAVEVAVVLRDPDRQTLTRRFPWLVAFGFGLFHGFGFAGALAEIGLPQGEIAAALFAFNIGVEAGQLLVIGALVAVLIAMTRWLPKLETPTIRLATYAIGGTGSFWLIERVVG
ncbi:HupE/UreJ family protein [Erythrobacter sp. Alg231-14]|uniref:HupE/UreJ family protein n=1 Tax=Erythrobacter sp. Alg231-14 TaxID=1922225 RepID=UPI00307BE1A2